MTKNTEKQLTKTGWHLLLTGAALAEFFMAKTDFRKLLCAACAGYHTGAAYIDWKEDYENQK